MKSTSILRLTAPALAIAISAGIAYGAPVRLVQSDAQGVVLVLETPKPELLPADNQPGRLEVVAPGLEPETRGGEPSLPWARALIGVPDGMRPVIAGVRGKGLKLSDASPAVKVVNYFGVTGEAALVPIEDLPLPAGLYPKKAAEVAWTGWMRDLRVAEIRLHPIRSEGAYGGMTWHPRLEVRVDFVPDPAAASRVSGNRAARAIPRDAAYRDLQARSILNAPEIMPRLAEEEQARTPEMQNALSASGSAVALSAFPADPVKIGVEEDGLYGISPADLSAAGVDPSILDPREFRMEFLGNPIPIEVTGESDGSFDPNDRVIFYGVAATGRQTRRNVYWLQFDGSPSRAATRDGTFGASAPTPGSFETKKHIEEDHIYTQNVPSLAIAHWWWKLQQYGLSSADSTYTVSLDNVDPNAHTITLRANIQGRTTVTHHTRLYLNGPQVDDQTWSGAVPFDHTVNLPSSDIASGSNDVRLVVVGDISTFDQVYSNFIEVTYRRTYDAISDSLVAAGEGPGSFRFAFNNFGDSGILLYDVTDPNAMVKVTVPAGQITGGGPWTISFQDTLSSNRLYAAATVGGLKSPASVVQDTPSNLAADPNGADWIVVTPPDPNFIAALQPLIAHREAQGYRVLVATTEDIYDEFNYGIENTSAIEAFMDNAWANYPAPAPEFLTLAGDAHVDYLDNFGSGEPELVPAKLVNISGSGETPSDNAYGMTAGGDVIPEVYVGRFPVRTAAALSSLVTKILDYENSPPVSTLNAQSLFVADNDDAAYEAILSSFATLIPPTMTANKIYMSQVGPPNMRSTIRSGFDAGALMATYLGHGSETQWASECAWANGNVSPCNADDPSTLAAGSNVAFLATLNCINGYFVDLAGAGADHVDHSLAESMLLANSAGAVAVWSPAAILGTASDYSSIGDWLFREIFSDRDYVLGRAAVTAAISAVTQPMNPAAMDNLREITFFGDPATVLALDSDGDGITDHDEEIAGTDPLDADSDDDGVPDGMEPSFSSDTDGDGLINGLDPDSDGDGILDGTEMGVTSPGPGTDVGAGHFVPDADPATVTDPLEADTDGGGTADGAEDRNFNGRVDAGETDPTSGHGGDDLTCSSALPEISDVQVVTSGGDVVLSWAGIEATHPCALYRIYAAEDVGRPDSFLPFQVIGISGSPGFVHVGAASDGKEYDYLIQAFDPLASSGPLGHYGQ